MTQIVTTIAPDDMVLLKTAGGADAQISGENYAAFATAHASTGGLPAAPVITSGPGVYPITGTAPAGSSVRVKNGATTLDMLTVSGGAWSYQPAAGLTATLTFYTVLPTTSAAGAAANVSTGVDWHAWINTPTLHVDPCVIASGSSKAYLKLWLADPTTGAPITADKVVLPVTFRIRVPNDGGGGLQIDANLFGPPETKVHHIRVGDDPVIYIPFDVTPSEAIAGRFSPVVIKRIMGCSTPSLLYGGDLTTSITVTAGGTGQNAPPANYHRPRMRMAAGTPTYVEDIANFVAGPGGVVGGIGGKWADDNNYFGGQSIRSTNVGYALAGYGSNTIAGMDGPTVDTVDGAPAIKLISKKLGSSITLRGYGGDFGATYQAAIMESRFVDGLCHRYGRWDVVAKWTTRRSTWCNFWAGVTRRPGGGAPEGGFYWPPEIDVLENPKNADGSSPADRTMANLHIGERASQNRQAETFDERELTSDGYPAGYDLTTQFHKLSLVITPPSGGTPSKIIRLYDDVEYNSAVNLFDSQLSPDYAWFVMLGVDVMSGNDGVFTDGDGTAYIRSIAYTPPANFGAITDVPAGVIDCGSYNPPPLAPTLTGVAASGKVTWSWADAPAGVQASTHRLYDGSTLIHTFSANEPSWDETGLANGYPVIRTLKAVGANGLISAASSGVTKTPHSEASVFVADDFNRADVAIGTGGGLGSTATGNKLWTIGGSPGAGISANKLVVAAGSAAVVDCGFSGDFDVSATVNGAPAFQLQNADGSQSVQMTHIGASSSYGPNASYPSNLYGTDMALRIRRVGDHFTCSANDVVMLEFDHSGGADLNTVVFYSSVNTMTVDDFQVVA